MYRTNEWHGMTHYECELCPFDTMNADEMARHIEEAHTAPKKVTVPASGLVLDRYGNPITEIVTEIEEADSGEDESDQNDTAESV